MMSEEERNARARVEFFKVFGGYELFCTVCGTFYIGDAEDEPHFECLDIG